MKRLIIAASAFLIAAAPCLALARDTVRVGVLTCVIAGGSGFILGSMKPLYCDFNGADGRRERYRGSMRKYGIDIGSTGVTYLKWIVFAPTNILRRGALVRFLWRRHGGGDGRGRSRRQCPDRRLRAFDLAPAVQRPGAGGGANIALGAAALTLRYVR